MAKATPRRELENAIAGTVMWVEHNHPPMPCCTEAIIDAVPDGWAKVGGEWIRLDLVESDPNTGKFWRELP